MVQSHVLGMAMLDDDIRIIIIVVVISFGHVQFPF